MLNWRGVNGTCVANFATLTDKNQKKFTKRNVQAALAGHGFTFLETTEEQKEFRDILIEFGASSMKNGNTYVHSINCESIPNPVHDDIREAIAAGKALSLKEGRASENEIRVGDRVVYTGYPTDHTAALANALTYFNNGNGVLVNAMSGSDIISWGVYNSNYWHSQYFRRIPGIQK